MSIKEKEGLILIIVGSCATFGDTSIFIKVIGLIFMVGGQFLF